MIDEQPVIDKEPAADRADLEDHADPGDFPAPGGRPRNTWGLIAEDARRLLATWQADEDLAAAVRRAQAVVAAEAAIRLAPDAIERMHRGLAAGLDAEGLRRVLAAVGEETAGLREGIARDDAHLADPVDPVDPVEPLDAEMPRVRPVLPRAGPTAAPTVSSVPAPAPPPDDHLVALTDLIDEVQKAQIKNPRTLKTFSAAAIYKGVQAELRRRGRGGRADRTSLYGVIADAHDPPTRKFRRGRFGAGLLALAKRRAAADGVLDEALALAAVEGRWDAERSALSKPRR